MKEKVKPEPDTLSSPGLRESGFGKVFIPPVLRASLQTLQLCCGCDHKGAVAPM